MRSSKKYLNQEYLISSKKYLNQEYLISSKKYPNQEYLINSLFLQAVLDNNLVVVQLLLRHGAQIDQKVTLSSNHSTDDDRSKVVGVSQRKVQNI